MIRLSACLALIGTQLAAHPHAYTEQQASLTLSQTGTTVEYNILPSNISGAEIFADLDLDGDGQLSDMEMTALATAILDATTLKINEAETALTLQTVKTPNRTDMEEGHALITIVATSETPLTTGSDLSFSVHFDQFDPNWTLQPWFENGFPENGILPAIQRDLESASLVVAMPAET